MEELSEGGFCIALNCGFERCSAKLVAGGRDRKMFDKAYI